MGNWVLWGNAGGESELCKGQAVLSHRAGKRTFSFLLTTPIAWPAPPAGTNTPVWRLHLAREGMASLNLAWQTPFCSWPALFAGLQQPGKAVKKWLSSDGGVMPEFSLFHFYCKYPDHRHVKPVQHILLTSSDGHQFREEQNYSWF